MARRTGRDEGVNADPGGQSGSAAPNLGAAQQSNYQWLGISERVEDGTNGTRPNSSHAKYGGERDEGELFKGRSAPASSTKEQNTRDGGEMNSAATGQYGPGSPNYLAGGVGSRENMTIGGDANRGQYVGDGVGSTPDTDVNQYFISGKVPIQMPREQYLTGTDQAKTGNMSRAHRGIGKNGPRRDSKNQTD